MKYLAVLMGLVCLVCSQVDDMESIRNQIMTAFTEELMKRGMDAAKADETAKTIVDNKDYWEHMLDDQFVLGSDFLSEMQTDDMLEMFLPLDVQATLQDGNQITGAENENEENK